MAFSWALSLRRRMSVRSRCRQAACNTVERRVAEAQQPAAALETLAADQNRTSTARWMSTAGRRLHPARVRNTTFEDTVEFFNLVVELKLTPQEKNDVVAFMRQL